MRLTFTIQVIILLTVALTFIVSLFIFRSIESPSEFLEFEAPKVEIIEIDDLETFLFTYISHNLTNEAFSLPLFRNLKASDLEFTPISSGFEVFQDRILFLPKEHKKCLNNQVLKYTENSEIVLNCDPYYLAEAYESPVDPDEELGNSALRFPLKQLPITYSFSNYSEYIYAQCEDKKGETLLRNIYKPQIAKETQKKTDELISQYKTKNFKPLTVVLFVVDSVSRQNFYRNLKNTVQFFNKEIVNSYLNHFVIYDFLMAHSIEPFTVPNMVPFLYGQSHKKIESELGGIKLDSPQNSKVFLEIQQNYSIWNYYKKKGFVTLAYQDTVNDYITKITGRVLDSDHKVCNFWNLAKQYFNYNEFDSKDLCIGQYLPHKYTLSYLSEYLKNYEGLNRFAYIHIFTAHEKSGVRIRHADADFTEFFNETLRYYKEIDEDIVFVFTSDHGSSNGDFVTVQGLAERMHPFTFVISNREYIEKHSFHKNLRINTERLISRYDWYKSLKHLAITPYGNSSNLEEINTEVNSVSLFLDEISFYRNCNDAGINPAYCLQKEWENIPQSEWKTQKTIQYLVDNSIQLIKNQVKSKNLRYCNEIILEEITSVKQLRFIPPAEGEIIHYLIEFKTSHSSTTKFLVHGTHAGQNKYLNLIEKGYFTDYQKTFVKRIDNKVNTYAVTKIWSVSHINAFAGPEENKSCADLILYKFNSFLSENNKTCEQTCMEKRLICVPILFKTPYIDYWESQGFKVVHKSRYSSIEKENNEIIIGEGEMCSRIYKTTTGLCNCMQI